METLSWAGPMRLNEIVSKNDMNFMIACNWLIINKLIPGENIIRIKRPPSQIILYICDRMVAYQIIMAKQTFKNLEISRQEEILTIAYEEFALKGYDSASLSEIVRKCGLAKGSFYRYFSSKKELYAYLIEDAAQKRLVNLDNLLNVKNQDFFSFIRQNFMEKVRFDLENPIIGGFLYKIMHEKDNNEVSDLIQGLYNRIIAQTEQIIKSPSFRPQLADVDTHLMAFQVFYMQLWLYDYVASAFNLDYEKNIRQNKPILSINTNDLERVIDQSVYMLEKGIKSP